jgi:hypothetical protein
MNKRTFVATLAAAALMMGSNALAQPVTARVTMEGTTIAVQPDPIRIRRAQGAVVIRWELPASANYSFDPQGIVIDGELVGGQLRPQDQIAHCGGGPRHITCTNSNSRRGTYKYTVRLLDANRRLVVRDPEIVNLE